MGFDTVAVIGAGTMGHGIAQVCAMAGCAARLVDVEARRVEEALERVGANLDKGVARGKVAPEVADAARERLSGTTSLHEAVEGADLVIEAVPEVLDLKREVLGRAAEAARPDVVWGTNTSSLPVADIAEAVPDPARLVGTHFFNPVHIMALLELVVPDGADPEVVEAVRAFGQRIGKEVVTVRDRPGFATSRLGVLLGMEAIRMVEEGVASPEDIDRAMVLGYRHPVGPLRLTDLVGLDVRLKIGEYLAEALGNPAFEPPELLRRMVAEGRLGRKTGQGFYRW